MIGLSRPTEGAFLMRMRIVFLLIVVLLLAAHCGTMTAFRLAREGQATPPPDRVISIPFKQYGHLLVVRVRLNHADKERSFIVDTGAFSVVDRSVAEELALPSLVDIEASDPSGTVVERSLSRLESVSLDDRIRVDGLGVMITDLGIVRRSTGFQVDGILGSNFLRHFRVLLDYSSGHIDFLPVAADLPGAGSVRLPMETPLAQGYAPTVDCLANGQPVKCILDTGSNASLIIPMELAAKPAELRIAMEGPGLAGAFGSTSDVILTRLNRLGLGSLQLDDMPAVATNRQHILVGRPLLDRFRMLIDYPNEVVVLVPTGRIAHNIFSSGIGLLRDEKNVLRVMSVVQGSPASALFRPGDEILSVNGVGAPDALRIQDMLNDPGVRALRVKYTDASGTARSVTLNKAFLLPGGD